MFNLKIELMTSKELTSKEFKAVLCNLHNNHLPHIFDYMGEYNTTHATTTIEDDENYIYQFDSFRDLYNNILVNLSELDLTQGDDDTFFDYNPANLEAIIYGLYILQFSDIDTKDAYDMLYSRFERYWNIRKTEELDVDDNDSIYESLEMSINYTNHKIKSLNSLEVAKYLK